MNDMPMPAAASRTQETEAALLSARTIPINAARRKRRSPALEFASPLTFDAYDLLRAKLLDRTRRTGENVILVASPNPGEGKTVTAINLALSFARHACLKAVLVDANLRSPKVGDFFSLPREALGVAQVVSDGAPLEKALVSPGPEKLTVLPAGCVDAAPMRILTSSRLPRLLRDLKNLDPNQYVIVDSSHLVGVPDALATSEAADGVLLVVEAGKTSRRSVNEALRLLEGRKTIGTVVNKAFSLAGRF